MHYSKSIFVRALSAALLLSGCSSSHDTLSDDAAVDGRIRNDARNEPDSAENEDTAVAIDAFLVDAAHPTDVGTIDALLADAETIDASPIVDGSVANDGAFTDTMPPTDANPALLPGELCDNATVLTPGVYAGQSTAGYRADYTSMSERGCEALNGPERVYAVDVPAGMRLSAAVTPGNGFDASINLARGPCSAQNQACIVGDDSGASAARNEVAYVNGSSAPERIYILVAGAIRETTGSFLLNVVLDAPQAGESCGNPIALTPGTLVGQSTVNRDNDFVGGNNCVRAGHEDLVYSISIPAGQVLTVRATPANGSDFDPTLNLVAAPASNCSGASATCIAAADNGTPGNPETLSYHNNTSTVRDVFVVVDGFFGAGEFTLDTSFRALAEGERCASATLVTSGTLAGQTTVGYADDYSSGENCRSRAFADRVYAMDVPSAMRLSVTATPAPSFDVSVSLASLAECEGQRICLDGSDSAPAGGAESVAYANVSAEVERVYIIVDGDQSEGAFALTTTLMPLN